MAPICACMYDTTEDAEQDKEEEMDEEEQETAKKFTAEKKEL